MAGQEYLARFAKVCSEIGDASADEQGFVRIGNLLERFQTQLLVRPLLVEGMIAEIKGTDDPHGAGRWAVLVDSESYGVSAFDRALRDEDQSQPLPTRMRYTIAHELAHSLAFRPDDFGIRLTIKTPDRKAGGALVNEIEAGTDSVTPLLLISSASLKSWLRRVGRPITAAALARFRADMGVSRQTLINRLKALNSPQFGEGPQPALQNLAIAVAEWGRGGQALLRKWPLFTSFERELLPGFLMRLQAGQDRALAEEIFAGGFAFKSSSSESHTFTTGAGTSATPDAEKMMVTVSFENGSRRPGSEFLVAIQGKLIRRDLPLNQRQRADRLPEGRGEGELQRIRQILSQRK